MEFSRHFDRQYALLEKRIKEMDEESSIIKALMSRLSFHALHLRNKLEKVKSAQMFCQMFKKINFILSDYVSILTEISSKMEIALNGGVLNWNYSYGMNDFQVKPLPSRSNNKKDHSSGSQQNDTKNLNTKEPFHSKQISCVENVTNHWENSLNHQLPSSENLMSDKELILSNGLALENSVPVNKGKLNIKEFNVAELAKKDYYGLVQHAVSPSEIYVCFSTKDLLLLEEFYEKMTDLSQIAKYKSSSFSCRKEKFTNFKKRKEKAMKELGDYVLHFSKSENKFYRSKIEDWNLSSNDDLVDLFFIDHGNKISASVDDVYPMPENLREYPAYSVKCHLCDVAPENDETGWGPIEMEVLSKWIVENKNRAVIAVGENHGSDPSNSVPIYLYDTKRTQSLNSLIRESRTGRKGVGKSENWGEALEEVLNEWNPMQEAYDSHFNSYELDTDNPAVSIYGHVPNDYKRICKIFRKTGRCYKGYGCRKEHVIPDKKGYTTDLEEVYTSSFNSLVEPDVGDVLKVHVTYIQSGCEFYCVPEAPKARGEEETLDSLVSYMNAKENVDNMKKLKIPPSIGQVVVSKFQKEWYRAKVLEVDPEGDEYMVFFVDYGNIETVSLSNLRAIEPQYLHLPFQAMYCKIVGTQIRAGAEEEALKFLDYNLPRNVEIRIMATLPGERPLLIVKVSTEEHEDFGKLLLEKEYAELKENFVLDESQSILPG